MNKDQRDTLDVLKSEWAFLEKGGYANWPRPAQIGNWLAMPTVVKVQIVQVPPEQRAQVQGATHACKHVADKLNSNEAVVPGRDFGSRIQPGDWAATCRMCTEYLHNLMPKV